MTVTRKERASKLVREYFAECESKDKYPSEAGMLLWLGIGEEEYRAMKTDKSTAGIFERAKLRRVEWLETRIARGGRGITGIATVLKREEEDATVKLLIRMEGLGGESAAE